MIQLSRTMAAAASFAAALCLAAPASAQSQVSVYYDNFDYTLVDLTPDDGIDPGISFYGSTITASASTYDSPYGLGTPRSTITDSATYGRVEFAISDGGSSLTGGYSPTSGSATLFVGHGSANIAASSIDTFVLAPNTQITFEVRGILNELNGFGGNAAANLTAIGMLYLKSGTTEYTSSLSTGAGDVYDTLSVVVHSGAEEVYGTLEYRSDLSAQVTPVPEPATTAMMIGGLGLVGALARRRRR